MNRKNTKPITIALLILAGFILTGCDLLSPPGQSLPPDDPSNADPTRPPVVDVSSFQVLDGPYFPFAQLENVVRDELGGEFVIADWRDLEAQQSNLSAFLDALGMAEGESYFVFWNGNAHPDKVASSGISAQHPGPAAFRYLAFRGSKAQFDPHFEDRVIVDDSLDPELILYRSWNEPGSILVVQE